MGITWAKPAATLMGPRVHGVSGARAHGVSRDLTHEPVHTGSGRPVGTGSWGPVRTGSPGTSCPAPVGFLLPPGGLGALLLLLGDVP